MQEDFDNEFTSDAEVEAALGEITNLIEKRLAANEEKFEFVDSEVQRQHQFAYDVLRYLTKGTDVIVSYKLHEPFQSMGSVSIEGESLVFREPRWIARIAEFASNMEVYPLADNRVRLTFTFHGLTKAI